MNRSVYEDFKYCMQDVAYLYVGSKYTLGELCGNEEISFKLRKVIAESVLPKADREDTLETVLYYLEPESFLVQLFKQIGASVRVSILEEKRRGRLRGRKAQSDSGSEGSGEGGKRPADRRYVTKFLTIPELVSMSAQEKQSAGLFIQELKISKLALLTV